MAVRLSKVATAPIRVIRTVKNRFKALPPRAIYQFAEIPHPMAADRIVFFAPHPDDEALAASGYLLEARQVGAECFVVLITDGNKRGLKTTRAQEFQAVVNALGIDDEHTILLDHPDGGLRAVDQKQLERIFEGAIHHIKPTIVIAPHPSDIHRDHHVVSKHIKRVYTQEKGFTLFQYLIHYPPYYPWPRKFTEKAPLLPPVNLLHTGGAWQIYPLKDEIFARKKEVIEYYDSQLKTPVLRSLMYAMIRHNELFMVYPAEV